MFLFGTFSDDFGFLEFCLEASVEGEVRELHKRRATPFESLVRRRAMLLCLGFCQRCPRFCSKVKIRSTRTFLHALVGKLPL